MDTGDLFGYSNLLGVGGLIGDMPANLLGIGDLIGDLGHSLGAGDLIGDLLINLFGIGDFIGDFIGDLLPNLLGKGGLIGDLLIFRSRSFSAACSYLILTLAYYSVSTFSLFANCAFFS